MNNDFDLVVRSIRRYIQLEKMSGIEDLLIEDTVPGNAGEGASSGLEALRAEVVRCSRCDLSATRTQIVFGSGDPRAKLMFIGEAPGQEEDLQGLPFVGRAGGLLTKIIEAMGMKRSDVYIANVLKCRPPNNRIPLPTEILACEENLRRQIESIRPAVICTLGKFASQALLRTQTPITALRGKFQEYRGIKVMPTFHPAYLLRNPQDKKLVWEDMKKVMSVLRKKER
jgi:uracil-DNA glycosylase